MKHRKETGEIIARVGGVSGGCLEADVRVIALDVTPALEILRDKRVAE